LVRRKRRSTLQHRERPSRDDHATDGGALWHRERLQCRDDGARALRAVFSSYDNWLDLSEAERDEWRGYFDRMLERLHLLGYTPERNPCSVLLEPQTTGVDASDEERRIARKQPVGGAGKTGRGNDPPPP
jgi:hypothetical protein